MYVLDQKMASVGFLNSGNKAVHVHGVKIAPGQLATVAGTGKAGFSGDGGKAIRARLGGFGAAPPPPVLREPARAYGLPFTLGSLAADHKGNLFIGDPANQRVRMVDKSGLIVTLAGEGLAGAARDCCLSPAGLAVDRLGSLYLSDKTTKRIWLISLKASRAGHRGGKMPPKALQLIAGSGPGGHGRGERAVVPDLFSPGGLTVDHSGTLFVTELTGTNPQIGYVRLIGKDGNTETIVGNGQGGFNGDGLKGQLTSLFSPTDVAVDRCGNLFVADMGDDRVRRLSERPSEACRR